FDDLGSGSRSCGIRSVMYFSELIRYLPGRAEPEVLGRIKHADRKDQARRSRSYLVGRSAASDGPEPGQVRRRFVRPKERRTSPAGQLERSSITRTRDPSARLTST